MDGKLKKSFSHFENTTSLYIFIHFGLSLSAFCPKLLIFDQLWTKKLSSSKCPTLFVGLLSKTVIIFTVMLAV
jgi:hypothetical protein